MIIKTTEELNLYLNKLNNQDYITVDTEFMREKTYWPEVCLIQIASDDIAFCIDPLADGIDLTELFKILQNKNIVKVFHSARQDIEIFVHLSGVVPYPIFDTQLAAMVCGLGETISYKDLVTILLDKTIDKGMRYTDWSKRPLDDRQIEYAMSDVTHLRDIYKILKQKLHDNGRIHWIDEEMDVLCDVNTYNIDPQKAYKRLKFGGYSGKTLGALRELAAWREEKAKEKNRPRGHVLKDPLLQELATFNPQSVSDLAKVRGISENGKYNPEIYAAILKGHENPEKNKQFKKRKVSKPLLDMLKLLLHIKSEDYGVASKLIAHTEDLEKIAAGEKDTDALKGWRKEIFGNEALSLKKGKVAFSFDPKTQKTIVILT